MNLPEPWFSLKVWKTFEGHEIHKGANAKPLEATEQSKARDSFMVRFDLRP